MNSVTVELASLLCTGLLAGALLVIDYGIRGPLWSLEQRSQMLMRKALIYRLRILMPVIFIPAVLTSVANAVLGNASSGSTFRFVGACLVVSCFVTTLTGTAPINKAVLSWDTDLPPPDWRSQIRRWERLDTFRTWTGITAFAFLLYAVK